MKIAVGQVGHETNTFSDVPTTVESFEGFEWVEGQDLLERHRGVRDYLGGMLARAEVSGVEVVPTFSAFAYPSGIITAETHVALRSALVRTLEAAGSVDAVCLALHGAGVSERTDDLETDILEAVRGVVGYSVPVVATLDLHANFTEGMVREADALLGVNFYPHTDSYERGEGAVDLARLIVEGSVRPVMSLTRIPLAIPTSTTNLPPAKTVNEICWEWEREQGVVDCTFFHGFPYADVPVAGTSVLAIADGDEDLARRVSAETAKKVWELREDFFPEMPSPEEGVRLALQVEGRPVVLNETSDNPGGGAPGDGTHLLKAMLDAGLDDACLAPLNDPEVARVAHEAGVGSRIEVLLGGKTDSLHGEPLRVNAYVKSLTDGRFVQSSPMWQGLDVDLGPSARLQIDGVDVVVCSMNAQALDEQILILHGIDFKDFKVVGLKSSQHFRAAFEDAAERIITVDSPGLSTLDLSAFEYHRLPRPLYPLDGVGEPQFPTYSLTGSRTYER
jgi:microcystin degradation protein MlrC